MLKTWLRWQWNTIRYELGFTNITPATHEFIRIMKELGYEELN